MNRRWPVIALTAFLVAGCAARQAQLSVSDQATPPAHGTHPALTFDSGPFGARPDIIPAADIFRLSEAQQADFKRYFESPVLQNIPVHERVFGYLHDITMYFSYEGRTFTAEQALLNESGNCLSLAILTTALANLAGVETAYQLVDSTPVYESHGDVVYKGQHVRTKLFAPGNPVTGHGFSLGRQGVLIDYFPSRGSRFVGNITEDHYIAMYYNNLASEAIARQDYDTAFWLLRETLALTPNDAGAINSMAVVHRRIGELDRAEQIYRYGIEYLPEKVSFLRNYRVLLEQQERLDEVQQINRELMALDDPSPFDWMHAGHDAFSDGDYREAATLYRKAAQVAPYLHESYAGLAKAYYMIGDRQRAEREFKKALEISQRPSTRSMYEAKLFALGQQGQGY